MQERKKIKKKERKKKKKPESEADPDPDPELDAVRADTSEAEPGEAGESSDEAAAQAASPQGSAEHVGPHPQEATDAAAAAGPAAAAAATAAADGEWPMCYVSLLHGTAVQLWSADSNPCFERVHRAAKPDSEWLNHHSGAQTGLCAHCTLLCSGKYSIGCEPDGGK